MDTDFEPEQGTESEETRPGALAFGGGMGELPDIVRRAGSAAVFAAEEFFFGTILNDHTAAPTCRR